MGAFLGTPSPGPHIHTHILRFLCPLHRWGWGRAESEPAGQTLGTPKMLICPILGCRCPRAWVMPKHVWDLGKDGGNPVPKLW